MIRLATEIKQALRFSIFQFDMKTVQHTVAICFVYVNDLTKRRRLYKIWAVVKFPLFS